MNRRELLRVLWGGDEEAAVRAGWDWVPYAEQVHGVQADRVLELIGTSSADECLRIVSQGEPVRQDYALVPMSVRVFYQTDQVYKALPLYVDPDGVCCVRIPLKMAAELGRLEHDRDMRHG